MQAFDHCLPVFGHALFQACGPSPLIAFYNDFEKEGSRGEGLLLVVLYQRDMVSSI